MNPADMGLEAVLAMAAGSDTTSTAQANVIYYLISYPAVTACLRDELDAVAGGRSILRCTLEFRSSRGAEVSPGRHQ